jgi:hypothetical protein
MNREKEDMNSAVDPVQVRPSLPRSVIIGMLVLVVLFSLLGAATVYLDGEIGNVGLVANQLFQGAAVFLLYYYLM